MKPKLYVSLSLVSFSLLAFHSYAKTTQEAKDALAQMNITFSVDDFLYYAKVGKTDVVELFLDAGMNPNAKNNNGVTALMWAEDKKHDDIVKLLKDTEANAKTPEEARKESAKQDTQNSDYKTKTPEEARNALAQMNIIYSEDEFLNCAYEGKANAVKLFLDAGINPNVKDNKGMTALMYAANNNHIEIVKTLLNKGVEVNAKAYDGRTALILVAQTGHTELVQALLDKGAEINAKDKNGNNALMCAVDNSHTDTVHALLVKGADVNAKSKGDWTALMFAAKNGLMDTVKILLSKGAEVNARDIHGKTALMAATYFNHPNIVKLLRSAEAIEQKSDQDVTTVLVNQKILSFINSLGSDILFFTSREHPISSLADLTDPDSQFAAGVGNQDVMKLAQIIGVQYLRVIVIGNSGSLFHENPQLKLFVTFRRYFDVNQIDSSADGIRVHFVESD